MNKKSGITISIITLVLLIFLLFFGKERIDLNLLYTLFALLLFTVGVALSVFGAIWIFTGKFNNKGFILLSSILTAILVIINIVGKL